MKRLNKPRGGGLVGVPSSRQWLHAVREPSRAPAQDAAWVAEVLQANGVAFACRAGNELVPLNERARETRLFAA
jgi:hypothetical protein